MNLTTFFIFLNIKFRLFLNNTPQFTLITYISDKIPPSNYVEISIFGTIFALINKCILSIKIYLNCLNQIGWYSITLF